MFSNFESKNPFHNVCLIFLSWTSSLGQESYTFLEHWNWSFSSFYETSTEIDIHRKLEKTEAVRCQCMSQHISLVTHCRGSHPVLVGSDDIIHKGNLNTSLDPYSMKNTWLPQKVCRKGLKICLLWDKNVKIQSQILYTIHYSVNFWRILLFFLKTVICKWQHEKQILKEKCQKYKIYIL